MGELKPCRTCRHSRDDKCLRDLREGRPPFTQAYEREYTDSDFCGPSGRYHELRWHDLTFVRAIAAWNTRAKETPDD